MSPVNRLTLTSQPTIWQPISKTFRVSRGPVVPELSGQPTWANDRQTAEGALFSRQSAIGNHQSEGTLKNENNEYEGESHDVVYNKGHNFLSHDIYENKGCYAVYPTMLMMGKGLYHVKGQKILRGLRVRRLLAANQQTFRVSRRPKVPESSGHRQRPSDHQCDRARACSIVNRLSTIGNRAPPPAYHLDFQKLT